jgi:hypothetical protein
LRLWPREITEPEAKGAFMAAETFKKRQKEAARKEKQQKKLARRSERKMEKAKTHMDSQEDNQQLVQAGAKHGPTIL